MLANKSYASLYVCNEAYSKEIHQQTPLLFQEQSDSLGFQAVPFQLSSDEELSKAAEMTGK